MDCIVINCLCFRCLDILISVESDYKKGGGMKLFVDTRKIGWEFEDNLGIDITDGMFRLSKVIDGVRMYPYVLVEFGRYYLEDY